MITKITNGSRPGDIAAYLHGPGRKQEHVYDQQPGGAVIGGTLGRQGERDGKRWAVDLREAASIRPDIEKPIWHMSLRNAAGDRVLSDRQWAEIAHDMGTRMGWADKPWVVVRHGEDHVHIVVSRVGDDGSVWNRRDDRYKARRAAVALEQKHDLTVTPERTSAQTRRAVDHQTTQGEHRKGARTGQTPERVSLAQRVRAARDTAAGFGREGFEDALTRAGVQWRINVAKTGTVSGYSFHLPGHVDGDGREIWWKASQLDKTLAWSQIRAVLETSRPLPVVEVPKKMFESSAKHAERVHAARTDAMYAKADQAYQDLPGVIAAKDSSTRAWWNDLRLQDRADRIVTKGRQQPASVRDSLKAALEARRLANLMSPNLGQASPAAPTQDAGRSYVDRTRLDPGPDHGRGRAR